MWIVRLCRRSVASISSNVADLFALFIVLIVALLISVPIDDEISQV